jgi:hypothetical protein
VRAAHHRAGVVAAGALVLALAALAYPYVREDVTQLHTGAKTVNYEARIYGSVPEAIAAAGGEAKLKSCGTVYTGAFQTQTVAWYLHLHETQIEIFAYPPGTTLTPAFTYLSRDPRFPTIARTRDWVIGSSCPG